MKKNTNLKIKLLICLLAVVCGFLNIDYTAEATDLGGYPVIKIKEYTVEGGMLEAGKKITVNITVENTSSNMDASSVVMTLGNSTASLYPAYGNDNQEYIGNMPAGSTKEVSIPLTIGGSFTGDAIDLSCAFEYGVSGVKFSNTSTVVIPTSGGSTIGVKSLDVSSHAIVNGKSLLSFGYVNQSSANITDAILTIDGNVSKTSKTIKLDTIYAGKSYSKDYYVIFTEPGNQQISVSLSYTDVDGTSKVSDLGTFGVTVSKEAEIEEENGQLSTILLWGGRGLACIAGLVALMVVVAYIRKR